MRRLRKQGSLLLRSRLVRKKIKGLEIKYFTVETEASSVVGFLKEKDKQLIRLQKDYDSNFKKLALVRSEKRMLSSFHEMRRRVRRFKCFLIILIPRSLS